MSLIDRMLKYDFAVYWASRGKTQFGKVLFEAPVEIKCRWEDGITVRRDADGVERIFNARVFVDRDMDVNGKLWHGKLVDVPVQDDPSIPPEEALMIERFDKTPNLRNKKHLRIAYL